MCRRTKTKQQTGPRDFPPAEIMNSTFRVDPINFPTSSYTVLLLINAKNELAQGGRLLAGPGRPASWSKSCKKIGVRSVSQKVSFA